MWGDVSGEEDVRGGSGEEEVGRRRRGGERRGGGISKQNTVSEVDAELFECAPAAVAACRESPR